MEKRLQNVLVNLEAFIGTYSQGGKVIPRRRFHFERNCGMHVCESRAVWVEIPARTGRGGNCPMEQGVLSVLILTLVECLIAGCGLSAGELIAVRRQHFMEETRPMRNRGAEILGDGLAHVCERFANT